VEVVSIQGKEVSNSLELVCNAKMPAASGGLEVHDFNSGMISGKESPLFSSPEEKLLEVTSSVEDMVSFSYDPLAPWPLSLSHLGEDSASFVPPPLVHVSPKVGLVPSPLLNLDASTFTLVVNVSLPSPPLSPSSEVQYYAGSYDGPSLFPPSHPPSPSSSLVDRYAICSKGHLSGDASSKGGLALKPLVLSQAGRKSNIFKDREKAVGEVIKGTHSTIIRDLREGSASFSPSK